MMNKDSFKRLAMTSVLGLVLSYTFVVLAVLPIRYLRLQFGRSIFWAVALLGSGGLLLFHFWQWAGVYLTLCLLIGSYRELEERKLSLFMASISSIAITLTGALVLFFSFLKMTKTDWQTYLLLKIKPIMDQFQQLPRFQGMSSESVIWYLPSGLTIMLMLILFISLTISPTGKAQRKNLLSFKLPDFLIWSFILGVALSFIPAQESLISFVGYNLLIISLASYFFQGLAVFVCFLDRFEIHGFWRLLALFLIFFQMFLFVCGLGILDYWFDFRSQTSQRKIKQKTFNS